MWIPKTEQELRLEKKNREKNAIYGGLLIFLSIPALLILKDKFIGTGGFKGAPFGATLSWEEILETLPQSFFASSIGGIISYILYRKIKPSTTQICLKCGKIKQFSKNTTCECNGKLKFLNEMKWVESVESNETKA